MNYELLLFIKTPLYILAVMREVWLKVENARHCANSLPKIVKRPYPNADFYMIYKGNEPASQYSGKA